MTVKQAQEREKDEKLFFFPFFFFFIIIVNANWPSCIPVHFFRFEHCFMGRKHKHNLIGDKAISKNQK